METIRYIPDTPSDDEDEDEDDEEEESYCHAHRNSTTRTSSSAVDSFDMMRAADEIEQILRDDCTNTQNNMDQIMVAEDNYDDEDEEEDRDGDTNVLRPASNVPSITSQYPPHYSSSSNHHARNHPASSLLRSPNRRFRRLSLPGLPGIRNRQSRSSSSEQRTPAVAVASRHLSGPSLQSIFSNEDRQAEYMDPDENDEISITEQDVNAYGLFDSAGADEARLRQFEQYQRRRQRRQSQRHQQSTQQNLYLSHRNSLRARREGNYDEDDDDEDNANGSISSWWSEWVGSAGDHSSTYGGSSGVIYDSKAHGLVSMPFLTPILMALSGLFGALVVLRLVVSLLTVTVGWMMVILLSGRLIHQLVNRPIHLFRTLHARPLISWAFLGGLSGMARVCLQRLMSVATNTHELWSRSEWKTLDALHWKISGTSDVGIHVAAMEGSLEEDFTSAHWMNDVDDFCWDPSWLPTSRTVGELSSIVPASIKSDFWFLFNCENWFSMQQDLDLIFGLLRGVVKEGIPIGILWYAFLGNAQDSSMLAQWLYDNVWRFARRQYREMVRQRHQARLMRRLKRQQKELFQRYQAAGDNISSHCTVVDETRKQCMICLEDFIDDEDDGNDVDKEPVSSIYQRYYLLCRHSFHACCIQEWLEINASCPVCRIPLDAAIEVEDVDDDVDATNSFARPAFVPH